MAENKFWFLVSYDIRDPKRLRRVAKKMEGYGIRIQFSVFRCRLNERKVERLKWELEKIMKEDDDLLIISLCSNCAEKVHKRSGNDEWITKPVTFEII